jgi:hypothetical protein
MRAILLATVVALGVGLIGTMNSTATPVNGSAILNAMDEAAPVEQVRGGGGGGFRGGGGGFRGGGFRGGGRGGGRYFRGGRWWYYGGCSFDLYVAGLC